MKYFCIFLTAFLIFVNTACSSNEHDTSYNEVKPAKDNEDASNLSVEDQKIIKKYKETINNLNFREREHANKVMKDSLLEVGKIKNDYEREKILMQIYFATAMYKEAYDLINKQLSESFSFARLMTKCTLSFYAERPKAEYEKCYSDLAVEMRKELMKTPQTDPEYIAGEWGYLLFMYQGGHEEYEVKLKEMLNSIKDKQLKYQFESSYELAQEQKQSYASK